MTYRRMSRKMYFAYGGSTTLRGNNTKKANKHEEIDEKILKIYCNLFLIMI